MKVSYYVDAIVVALIIILIAIMSGCTNIMTSTTKIKGIKTKMISPVGMELMNIVGGDVINAFSGNHGSGYVKPNPPVKCEVCDHISPDLDSALEHFQSTH
jgi:hypothetical protein